MEIAANREFGQLAYTLIRDRFTEGGTETPALVVPNLGSFLEIAGDKLRERRRTLLLANTGESDLPVLVTGAFPEWLHPMVEWDPHTQLIIRTFLMMVWLSLLAPEDGRYAVQVLPHTDKFFKERGLRQLTEEEYASLGRCIEELNARQQPEDRLGAAGDALLTAARRPLLTLPARGTMRARRNKFLRSAEDLCLTIENTRTLAERKAMATQLGELLARELKASGTTEQNKAVETYWEQFNLFFRGSKLAL